MGQLSKIVTRGGEKRISGGKISPSLCDSFTGHCKMECPPGETIISLLNYLCLTFV